MNNESDNLPPVVPPPNNYPQNKPMNTTQIIIIISCVVIIGIFWQIIKININNQERTQQQQQVSGEQYTTTIPQQQNIKSKTVPDNMIYSIKVGDSIAFLDGVFQDYQYDFETVSNSATKVRIYGGVTKLRVYNLVSGNFFTIRYRPEDNVILNLELADRNYKPLNVQAIPGYPLLTAEQANLIDDRELNNIFK